MNKVLRLPLYFVFVFLVILILLSGLNLLSFWGSRYIAGADTMALLQRIPMAVSMFLPVSVLLSILLLHFQILKDPGSRLLSFLIPLILGMGVLILGVFGLHRLPMTGLTNTPGVYLSPGKFNILEDKVLYVERFEGNRLIGVVLVDMSNPNVVFSYYQQAVARMDGNRLSVALGPELLTLQPDSVYGSLFEQNRVIASFGEDLRVLNRELDFLFENSRQNFLILCFALVFVLVASGALIRVSRWPLFNVLLGFLVVRGVFYLFRFLREDITPQLGKVINRTDLLTFLPTLVLLVLGVLLLIIDLLFIRFDRWKGTESE